MYSKIKININILNEIQKTKKQKKNIITKNHKKKHRFFSGSNNKTNKSKYTYIHTYIHNLLIVEEYMSVTFIFKSLLLLLLHIIFFCLLNLCRFYQIEQ